MDVKDIFNKLESGKYFIEHSVQEIDGQVIIFGHVSEKQNPSGFGRREFSIKESEEQNAFIEAYTEYFKKIIG